MDKSYSDYGKFKTSQFEILKGKVIEEITGLQIGSEQIIFTCTDGERFSLTYWQDCCASCSIEDICGDNDDLLGTEILLAECVESDEPSDEVIAQRRAEYEKEVADYLERGRDHYYNDFENFCSSRYESETWAFYKLSTIKGSVTIRWYGSSNGYYSETASFERMLK